MERETVLFLYMGLAPPSNGMADNKLYYSHTASPFSVYSFMPNSKSGTYVAMFSGLNGGGILTKEQAPYNNIYIIEYVKNTTRYFNDGSTVVSENNSAWTYTIAVVYNHLPLKKYTILDVIDRTFDLIEPLRDGVTVKDTPKFVLRESERAKLDKVLSPEFAFTKMNLREQLKQVSGYMLDYYFPINFFFNHV